MPVGVVGIAVGCPTDEDAFPNGVKEIYRIVGREWRGEARCEGDLHLRAKPFAHKFQNRDRTEIPSKHQLNPKPRIDSEKSNDQFQIYGRM